MSTPRPPFSPTGAGSAPQRRSTRTTSSGAQTAAGGSGGSRAGGRPPTGGGGSGSGGSGGGRPRAGGAQGGGGRRSAAAASPGRRRLLDYPRAGRTGWRRWVPSWRQVLGVFLLAVLAVVLFVLWAYARTELPTPDKFAQAQNTTVYYADGTTEMATFGAQNRVIVDGDQIAQSMKDAIVAAEDRSFYENPGIDPVGIARAFWNNLRGGQRQGGSTITQQYAERYYYGQTRTSYWEKFEEALLAVKLDRQQDKDEILENYLNTIFFGRGSYGIETAAQSYFGVSAAELTVEQSALIAGVVPSPNNWDPRVDPERAEQRWNYVMDGLVVIGALTQAERDAATMPETIEWVRSDRLAGPQGYLVDMVRREILDRSPITEEELESRGYRIVTTIDPAMQQSIVETAQSLPEDAPENLRVAMVTLAPEDGAIKALYGGPDFLTVSRNAVTQDTAQAGSTFKPFTLVAYLQDGGSLKSRYSGRSPMPIEGWDGEGPRNYGNQSFGEIDVLRATEDSVNTVYAQMNAEIGPERTVEAAVAAGIPEGTRGLDPYVSNVLGTASPRPIDLARGFNTFAAGGIRTTPHIVATVEYLDGGTVYQGAQNGERAFDEDVMADTTFALRQVIESGSGTRADIGRPAAGKTGTSSDNRSAWFIGYVPQLTTAVGLYQVGEDGASEEEITPFGGFREITGGSVPAQLWATHMQRVTEGMEVLEFPARADVGEPNLPPIVSIPDVVGMSQDEATSTLEGAGFGVSVATENHPDAPEGQVFAQNPSGRAEVGTTVTITVSEGPGTEQVPDVVGMEAGSARRALENAGFSVSVEERESDERAGRVISQSPGGGSDAEPGATVSIVVSTGPAEEEEPDPEPTDPPDDPTPPPGDGGGGGEDPPPPPPGDNEDQ